MKEKRVYSPGQMEGQGNEVQVKLVKLYVNGPVPPVVIAFKMPSQEFEHKALVVDKTETGKAITVIIVEAEPVQDPDAPSSV